MKRLWIRLTDNSFWYIGYTSTELGDRDYDKAFCLIVRNPFDRSWKQWEAARLAAREHKAWVAAANERFDKTLEDKDKS